MDRIACSTWLGFEHAQAHRLLLLGIRLPRGRGGGKQSLPDTEGIPIPTSLSAAVFPAILRALMSTDYFRRVCVSVHESVCRVVVLIAGRVFV